MREHNPEAEGALHDGVIAPRTNGSVRSGIAGHIEPVSIMRAAANIADEE